MSQPPVTSDHQRARAAARLRTALELSAFGRQMKLQQLRRQDPAASEAELRQRLLSWLLREDETDLGPCIRIRERHDSRSPGRDAPSAG